MLLMAIGLMACASGQSKLGNESEKMIEDDMSTNATVEVTLEANDTISTESEEIVEEVGKESKEIMEETGYEIDEDNIVTERVEIEGLQEEYELLFLTDTHIALESLENSDEVINYAMQRAPLFQDAEGIPSAELYPSWMDYAVKEELDGVLLGGDIIDFPSLANVFFLQEQHAKLNMPYIYVLGNHDWTYPWDYMTESGKQEYLPMLESMMSGNTAIQSYDYGEFIVVAVDNSSGQINPDALELYEDMLKQGKPVILMVHVPLLTESVLSKSMKEWDSEVVIGNEEVGGIQPNDVTEQFITMTTSSESPVELVLAGHVHFYDKDYIQGDKDILQIVGDAGYKRIGMHLIVSGK